MSDERQRQEDKIEILKTELNSLRESHTTLEDENKKYKIKLNYYITTSKEEFSGVKNTLFIYIFVYFLV